MTTKRLLILDDDPEIIKLIKNIAERCSFEVRAAEEAAGFQVTYRDYDPDVIVLDLGMPDVDGIQVIRFLAEEGCRAQLLIMSGYDAKVRQAAERLGAAQGLRMAGTVPKPVRAAELRAVLNALAGGD